MVEAADVDLSALIDAVDLPVLLLGRDATVLHCNAAASRFLSLEPADLGQPLRRDGRLDGLTAAVEELVEQVLAGRSACQQEARAKDGSWFVVRTTPYLGVDRQVAGAVVTFTNVTGFRASMEQSIYEREYTKTILNAVIDPLIVLDAQLRVQTANRAFHAMFQVSREQTLGLALYELGKGEWDIPELRARLGQCLTGEPPAEPLEIQMDVAQLGHRTLTLEPRRLPRDSRHRDLILLGIEDITDRLEATRTLAQQGRSLASEVWAMNCLLDMVGRLLGCADVDSALNEFLDAAMTLVSADMGLVQLCAPQSRSLRIVAHRGFTASSLERFRALDGDGSTSQARAFATGQRVIIEDVQAEPENPQAAKAASEDWHGVQSTPLLGREGTPLGVLSTHYREPHRPSERELRILDLYARQAADFIERINVEEALRVADRRKDEFLATLAHELRNPLAPVRLALDLLRREPEPSPVHRHLDMMDRQVGNLERIVDDLLEVSRITRGKIELQRRRLSLSMVVSAAIESARPTILARKHEVSVALPVHPVFIEADPVRIEQILTNVLVNAAKYTEPGGRIRVSVERVNEDAEVRVADTGIGIPEEMLPRVFEMFEQGRRDLARSSGGLGIGLSIVKTLTELHGGTVVATSAGAGKGSEFVIRFPVAPDDGALEHTGTSVLRVTGADPRRRILVVDDNEDAGEILAEILRHLGHDVRTARDGLTAIALATDWEADVIFLDIGLPGMDGYAIAREIRRRAIHSQLVALTGYGHAEARKMSRDAGFSQHLVKPPALETILGVLDGVGVAGVGTPSAQ